MSSVMNFHASAISLKIDHPIASNFMLLVMPNDNSS